MQDPKPSPWIAWNVEHAPGPLPIRVTLGDEKARFTPGQARALADRLLRAAAEYDHAAQ
jgi:hypothetical protein